MSTGIMRGKIEQEAKKNNVEMKVTAVGMDTFQNSLKDVHLVLLGPQISYAEKEIKGQVGDLPVMIIEPIDFGRMRGDEVYKKMMKVLAQ
jgi:PTS system cellobiose-specific IIB component